MPIPPQNDFLLPFLNLLGNGQALTRAHMTFQLTRQFGLTEE